MQGNLEERVRRLEETAGHASRNAFDINSRLIAALAVIETLTQRLSPADRKEAEEAALQQLETARQKELSHIAEVGVKGKPVSDFAMLHEAIKGTVRRLFGGPKTP